MSRKARERPYSARLPFPSFGVKCEQAVERDQQLAIGQHGRRGSAVFSGGFQVEILYPFPRTLHVVAGDDSAAEDDIDKLAVADWRWRSIAGGERPLLYFNGAGMSAKPFDFRQRIFLSAALTQNKRAGSAMTKTLPSATIGDEYLFGPIFVVQTMFFVGLQFERRHCQRIPPRAVVAPANGPPARETHSQQWPDLRRW